MQGFIDTGVSMRNLTCFSIFLSKKWTFPLQKQFEIEEMVVVIVLFGKTGAGMEI